MSLNPRFRLPREQLEEKLGVALCRNNTGYNSIIPLREVARIDDLTFVRGEVLETLICSIPLRGTEQRPYEDAEVMIYGVEPKGLVIGQTFVSQQKLLSIMEAMRGVFSSYVTAGVSQMPPAQIFGEDDAGKKVMAFYIPPIVEQHDGLHVLLDGIHRSYICSSVGSTVNAIHVRRVNAPLPFNPICWKDVRVVTEKPPVAERYLNLRQEYFRDLTAVGIDG
ncbi:hypothetical protein HYX14_01775 [Candidatus Woesearchaeota archaeon]|nr:hypothetical protein [Candidatus Woesearchaeota archaeon]